MKTKRLCVPTGVAALVCAAAIIGWVAWQMDAASLPQLDVQKTEIDRAQPMPASLAPIGKQVSPSVVNVSTTETSRQAPAMSPFFDDPFFRHFFGMPFEDIPRERRERALGSGVIVNEDGYILTNHHVVDGADEIKVALVTDVDRDSPAYSAGLRPGDVIVEINRRRVADADEAIRLSRLVEDDTVLLRIWSNGGSRYVVVEDRRVRQ